MAFNYERIHKKAHGLITRFGRRAMLRRDGTDRPCTAVVIQYAPRERGLRLDGSQRTLISKLDPVTRRALAITPHHELDVLVFNGEVLKLVGPDEGPRPNGDPVYHEFEVMYDSRDV